MANPQPARDRALSDDLPTDQWVKLRDELAELEAHLDQSPIARWAGSTVAGLGGRVVGIGRGMVHNAEGVADAVDFGSRVGLMGGSMDPSVFKEIFDTEKGLLGTATVAATHPKATFSDAQKSFDSAQRKINPWTAPKAQTFSGAAKQNYELGKNQGELGLDAVMWAYRGPKVANLVKPVAGPQLRGVAKYLAQGFSREDAQYLAELDDGIGHHYFARRKADAMGIPRKVQDNLFNVLHPTGIDRGEMRELHARVDPHYQGSGKSPGKAGVRWSAKELGIKRYDPVERIWYGAPDALKVAIGGPLAMGLLWYEADKKKKSNAPPSGR